MGGIPSKPVTKVQWTFVPNPPENSLHKIMGFYVKLIIEQAKSRPEPTRTRAVFFHGYNEKRRKGEHIGAHQKSLLTNTE